MSSENHKKAKILVIEDEFHILLLVRKNLELSGYEVTGLERGTEAVDTVKSWKPDLILLDLLMPHPTGFETYSHLKADTATADIPIIFMTVQEEQQIRKQMYLVENDEDFQKHHLHKPFSREELLSHVEAILGNRL